MGSDNAAAHGELSTKIIIAVVLGSIIFCGIILYARFFERMDFMVSARAVCDPTAESCFVEYCDPTAADASCTGNPATDTVFYKEISAPANALPGCSDESCVLLDGCSADECEETLCDPMLEDRCSNHVMTESGSSRNGRSENDL